MSTQAIGSTVNVMSFFESLPFVFIMGFIGIGLWAGVITQTSSIIGDLHHWEKIKAQITKVIGTTMVTVMVLLVFSLIYFLQDQTKSIYTVFILIGLAAALSYSALAAAVAN